MNVKIGMKVNTLYFFIMVSDSYDLKICDIYYDDDNISFNYMSTLICSEATIGSC